MNIFKNYQGFQKQQLLFVVILLLITPTILFSQQTLGIEWQKCLGGSFGDNATSIIQTADGGYAVAGTTESNDGDVTTVNHGGLDIWVVKLNSSGVIEWQKSLGGSDEDSPTSI